MEIEFAAGDSGFYEAQALARIVEQVEDRDPTESSVVQLLDTLGAAARSQLGRSEFAALRAAQEDRDDAGVAPTGGFWRSLFGPSRREILLSAQRSAALERAERAERSSFEAVAETARVARERDALKARVAALEAELAARDGG
jgi:hypothetical protein